MKNYNFMLSYKKFNKKKNIAKNVISITLLALLFVVVLLYGVGKIQILHILTNSSAPFHPAGSLAIEYKVNFDDLQVGDFITWSTTSGKMFVTHQVVEVDKVNKTVTTSQQQFDSNHRVKPMSEWDPMQFDSPKTESQYYGKVLFSIPKLGLYFTSLKEMVVKNGTLNVLGTMIIILAILAYYLFAKLVKKPTFVLMGS